MPQPNALRVVVWITLSSSLLAALFAFAENRPHGIADFVNTELHGVLAGGLNGGILSSLEILVLRGAYGASLRQLPFLPYLALRSLLYLGIIQLVLIASNLRVGVTRADIAFSLAMSLGFNLLLASTICLARACSLRLRRRTLLPRAARGAHLAVHRHARFHTERGAPRRRTLFRLPQPIHHRPAVDHRRGRGGNPQICRRRD